VLLCVEFWSWLSTRPYAAPLLVWQGGRRTCGP
jgi:hypothetical protein